MKKFILAVLAIVFIWTSQGDCGTFRDEDQKTTPEGTDAVLISEDPSGTYYVELSDMAGVIFQGYDADLTLWGAITPSANMKSLAAAATYAAMRTLLDLEPGTDFYSTTAADTAFLEATQLNDTKGNGDTTFIYSADKVFDLLALKAPLASPDFTGTMTATGSLDGTIATTTAGGETGLYYNLTHATNALTGELIGVKGNARVNAIDSAAGSVIGGYFTAGNTTYGSNLSAVRGIYTGITNKVSSSGNKTWTYARGIEVNMDLDQGASDKVNTITNAAMFYGIYNLPTSTEYATVTTGYGAYFLNEAVGGTGQALDAIIYGADKSMSGGIYGWDFGIDFSGIASGKFTTADFRGALGETIANYPDGTWDFGSAIIKTTGALTISAGALTNNSVLGADIDVTDFTLTDFTGEGNWKNHYTDGSGDVTEQTVGAANTFWGGEGVTSAPAWQTLVDADIPAAIDPDKIGTDGTANDKIEAGNINISSMDITAVDSIVWNAGGMIASGTCTDAAEATINSGPIVHSIICTDALTSIIDGSVTLPDGYNAASTVTFELSHLQSAAETLIFNSDIKAMCRSATDTANNTWGSAVAIDDGAVTGSNGIDHTTSAAVTPNGTCAAGDTLFWKLIIHTDSTVTFATHHILGMKMEFTKTLGD